MEKREKVETFSTLVDTAAILVTQGKYDLALDACNKIILQEKPLQLQSLGVRLLKAECLWRLNESQKYGEWLEEVKGQFPLCHPNIQEFVQRLTDPLYRPLTMEFGKLFKTFRGWERIERALGGGQDSLIWDLSHLDKGDKDEERVEAVPKENFVNVDEDKKKEKEEEDGQIGAGDLPLGP